MKVKKLDLSRRAGKILQLSLNSSRSFARPVRQSPHLTEKCTIRTQKIDKVSMTFKPAEVDRDLNEFNEETSYLGEGSFGKVLLGRYNGNLPVAVKMFKRDNVSEVYTEAQVYEYVQRVKLHPNFPFYFGVSVNMKPFYLVTQFIGENASLTFSKAIGDQVISHHSHVRSVMLGISEALIHLHANGWLHNDLKRNNVLLKPIKNDKFHPVLIDFGRATKLSQSKAAIVLSLKPKMSFRKRSPWIAHEVAYGEPCSIKSDVYSFGYLLIDFFVPKENQIMTNPLLKELFIRCTNRKPAERSDLKTIKLELTRNIFCKCKFCNKQ